MSRLTPGPIQRPGVLISGFAAFAFDAILAHHAETYVRAVRDAHQREELEAGVHGRETASRHLLAIRSLG